ncbi:MAG: PLP-dependent aminotransferase family protein [Micromonosporaceae bacterium]
MGQRRKVGAVDVHVSLDGRAELATQIYRQLRAAMLDGRLRVGERLPPTREFAARLAVSRNTVSAAYDRLIAEGFLASRVGSGTFVRIGVPGPAGQRNAPGGAGLAPRTVWRSIPRPEADPPGPPPYDFSVGVPDPGLFPADTWRRLIARELRASALPPHYGEPEGHEGLRTAIARHAGMSRSVKAGADDVIVTHGAQQALDLLGRVLIGQGDRVAVEEPGYPPARWLFQSLGAEVTGVPVDGEGIDVAAIPDGARLVYTTPSHQHPLGVAMSLQRRIALLDWAQAHDAVIVEDDYDSEFRFSSRPLEPLQSLDRAGRVAYVGTFAKTMLPALRLGFLIAPASLRDALRTAKQLTDWHVDLPSQAALARFIDDGLFARHLRKANRSYAARHEMITKALERDFAPWLRLIPSVSGLHVCALLEPDTGIVPSDLVRRARRRGVAVEALAGFCGGTPQAGLVIGYGAIREELIGEGLRRLAGSFK